MTWITENLRLIGPLVAAALGVWWLLPQRSNPPKMLAMFLAFLGMGLLAAELAGPSSSPLTDQALFALFGGGAIVCGILMITCRNPVYGALWFALVTLCTCGLFLLQSAVFLAAATIIVYAGAIIVTFLFVIMLAQQEGATVYDQRSRQPLLATATGFILLGALLTSIRDWTPATPVASSAAASGEASATVAYNPFSKQTAEPAGDAMQSLGRSLFGDYLFAVELAGSLLMIASIGAILIAPRRSGGTL